jgi:hypothetical protein
VARKHWKIYCTERDYPGLWHTWFRDQIAAVGWGPMSGYSLREKGKQSGAWTKVKNCLLEMKPGDGLLVQLPGNRVGRVGEIVRLEIEDNQWDETVPARDDLPGGEMGRRVLVRWDLRAGPPSEDEVIKLPSDCRLTKGKARPTVAQLELAEFDSIVEACQDRHNWVSLLSTFAYERSISEYIAAFPHRLEDGLRPYPDQKAHQFVFGDQKRADALLVDALDRTVVVECKQGGPSIQALDQVRGYVKRAAKAGLDRGKAIRAVLVHGGAARVPSEISDAAGLHIPVELVSYRVSVSFTGTQIAPMVKGNSRGSE